MSHQRILILEDFQGLEAKMRQEIQRKYDCVFLNVSAEMLDQGALKAALAQCHLALMDAQIEYSRLEEVVEGCREYGIPVLILSEESVEAFGSKPSYFLQKPFTAEDLFRVIETVLEETYLLESA